MVYSDTSTSLGLVQDTRFLAGLPTTDTTAYPIADITRSINSYYDRVVSLIIKADNHWEWDDNNQTDLPIGTCALVADQQDYGITGSTFLKILKVELKNQAGNWLALSPITLDDKRRQGITDYKKTAGTPTEYDKLGNSIFLYPKPSYAQASSLKIFFQRNVVHFTASDTTKVAGFAELYHRILSLGAAEDYCIRYEIYGRIPALEKKRLTLEAELVNFYSTRSRDEKTTLKIDRYNDLDNYGDGRRMGRDIGYIRFN